MNIGIISASSKTIKTILQVAHQLNYDKVHKFYEVPYDELTEIPAILTQQKQQIDGWLFSGPNPYIAAKPFLHKDDNAIFCNVTGNEIYKYLLEYIYEKNSNDLHLSIDYPSSENFFSLSDSLDELQIPSQDFFLHGYNHPFDIAAILQFHEDLWNKKKTTLALTTLYKVYIGLQKKQIPVKKIEVSINAIRQALHLLDQKLTGLYFKRTQVGLAIFQLKDYSSIFEQIGNSYKMQKLDLEIKNQLLHLCQEVNGYLSDKSNGYYEIFASRGLLEESKSLFDQTLKTLKENLGLEVTCGIGFGSSAFTAQVNAHRALTYQKNIVPTSIVFIDEKGEITEHHNKNKTLAYRGVTEAPELVEKLKAANISITTYNKILAIVQKMNFTTFTAAQLAQQLQVSERNMQRILAGLTKSGLLTVSGQESFHQRGRPTKKYQIHTIDI